MTWQGGRQLSSMQKDGTTLSFSYNDAGLRTEKTVNGSTRRYVWNSGRLVADMGASDAFYFRYSSGGELIGFTYKTADAETECILVKNQQGDVERVISADGTVLASYTYDAWGNVLTSEGTLAASNPIRYRGYYFDTETSLYYLQSRYYDPAVGRFINADGYTSTDANGLLSANMFAYCENNPVSRFDPEGTDWRDAVIFGLVVAAVGLLILATLPFSGPLLATAGIAAVSVSALGTAVTVVGMTIAGGAIVTKIVSEVSKKSGDNRRGKDYVKAKNNRQANQWAQEFGYDGAESLKADYVGSKGSQFNMFTDRSTGEIILIGIRNAVEVATKLIRNLR